MVRMRREIVGRNKLLHGAVLINETVQIFTNNYYNFVKSLTY